jgi:hypothetical protein
MSSPSFPHLKGGESGSVAGCHSSLSSWIQSDFQWRNVTLLEPFLSFVLHESHKMFNICEASMKITEVYLELNNLQTLWNILGIFLAWENINQSPLIELHCLQMRLVALWHQPFKVRPADENCHLPDGQGKPLSSRPRHRFPVEGHPEHTGMLDTLFQTADLKVDRYLASGMARCSKVRLSRTLNMEKHSRCDLLCRRSGHPDICSWPLEVRYCSVCLDSPKNCQSGCPWACCSRLLLKSVRLLGEKGWVIVLILWLMTVLFLSWVVHSRRFACFSALEHCPDLSQRRERRLPE